jgi:hypothetical protein
MVLPPLELFSLRKELPFAGWLFPFFLCPRLGARRALSQFGLGCPASIRDPPISPPGFTEWDGNDTI